MTLQEALHHSSLLKKAKAAHQFVPLEKPGGKIRKEQKDLLLKLMQAGACTTVNSLEELQAAMGEDARGIYVQLANGQIAYLINEKGAALYRVGRPEARLSYGGFIY